MLNARCMVLKLRSADIQHILKSQLRTQIWHVCYDCFWSFNVCLSFRCVAHFTWECSNSIKNMESLLTSFHDFELCFIFRYLAHGTATDFMYDIAKVPMAFTFEVCEIRTLTLWLLRAIWLFDIFCIDRQIYGDEAASSQDCFKMFNPTDLTTFNVCLHGLLQCLVNFFLFPLYHFLNRNNIWGEEICSWLKCVWYCDFKPNCRKCIVWECVFEKMRFENARF